VSELAEASGGEPAAAEAPAPSIGLLLRKAREARGLAIVDVVQTLKFSPRQIEAVEANQFSALPGQVFVRGLLRSYARYLKIDPEPLLGLLARDVFPAEPEIRPPDNMGNATPKEGTRQMPPLVAVSILLLVASVTMAVWHFLVPKKASPPPAAEAVLAAPPTPVSGAETPPLAPAGDPPLAISTSVATPAAQPVFPPAGEPEGSRQLRFSFRGKSWIEVRDASQQIVLTGQYAGGSQEVVAGRAPFQIVIGNAAQVDLRYGDEVVDLKPFTRAEVARLSLD
jgi:cytoskeleton protein RodZ